MLASRKELLDYDFREHEGQSEGPSGGALLMTSQVKGMPGKCYGCATAATEHCVTLLRALAIAPGTRQSLVQEVETNVFIVTVYSDRQKR